MPAGLCCGFACDDLEVFEIHPEYTILICCISANSFTVLKDTTILASRPSYLRHARSSRTRVRHPLSSPLLHQVLKLSQDRSSISRRPSTTSLPFGSRAVTPASLDHFLHRGMMLSVVSGMMHSKLCFLDERLIFRFSCNQICWISFPYALMLALSLLIQNFIHHSHSRNVKIALLVMVGDHVIRFRGACGIFETEHNRISIPKAIYMYACLYVCMYVCHVCKHK